MMSKNQYHLSPEFVYVARNPSCGCVVGLISDYADKETGEAVAECISEGAYIERVAWQIYKDQVSQEPTFLACPHQPIDESEVQITLFEESGS